MRRIALVVLLTAAIFSEPAAQTRTDVFVGSTPCAELIRTQLAIPRDATVGLIEWELTLTEATGSRGAATYHLRYKFGQTRPNQPGLDATAASLERRGTWRLEAAAPRQPASGVVVLDNGLSLLKVTDTILHALAPDRSLMVGNGGWSYTLSRRDAIEPDVDPGLTAADPGDPDGTTSRATGAAVFGIFDGRGRCFMIRTHRSRRPIGSRAPCTDRACAKARGGSVAVRQVSLTPRSTSLLRQTANRRRRC
jgi:hypothetical protein